MGEQQNQQKKQSQEPDLNQLLKVRREKLAELQAAGKDPFQITKYDVTVHSMDVKDNYAEWEGKEVSIAGRMMSKRVMGKASFCNIQDLFSAMWHGMIWEKIPTKHLKRWISEILWVWKALCLPPRWERYPFMPNP